MHCVLNFLSLPAIKCNELGGFKYVIEVIALFRSLILFPQISYVRVLMNFLLK